jgi:hypothetical protein
LALGHSRIIKVHVRDRFFFVGAEEDNTTPSRQPMLISYHNSIHYNSVRETVEGESEDAVLRESSINMSEETVSEHLKLDNSTSMATEVPDVFEAVSTVQDSGDDDGQAVSTEDVIQAYVSNDVNSDESEDSSCNRKKRRKSKIGKRFKTLYDSDSEQEDVLTAPQIPRTDPTAIARKDDSDESGDFPMADDTDFGNIPCDDEEDAVRPTAGSESNINMSIQQDDSLSLGGGGLSVGGLDVCARDSNNVDDADEESSVCDDSSADPPTRQNASTSQSVGDEGEPDQEEEDENNCPPPVGQDELPPEEDEPTVWACSACTFFNSKGFHCDICRTRRLTQEERDADAVAAHANEDLSEDDGTEYKDDGKEYNEESVTSSPKDDDENNVSPEYTATDPTARKRVPTLRESTNTSSTFCTPAPSTRCNSAPDLAKKRSKVPTCRKLLFNEIETIL